MKNILLSLALILLLISCSEKNTGQTEITKWQDGKRAAVSITYDDGSINQFRKALPIMNSLGMPGTFFINTGSIPGSQYKGQFIGRPVKEIIAETAKTPTNKDNFLERASAARFLGLRGTSEEFTKAGSAFDAGRDEEAYKIIDELYSKVRKGGFSPEKKRTGEPDSEGGITWEEIKAFAEEGHEFASHMVTHPYMAALDEPNMIYELEKSKEELLNKLGPKYTFSAECPYGTENERVMEYAYKVYPALRNRMPETFLEELNRSSKENPGSFDKEYVQWQRGATTKTPFPMMKSWVDTTAANDNIWLVLVIHGVDGIGWEALPGEMLDEYFRYIKSKDLWVATFCDAAKYMRERMNSRIESTAKKGTIAVTLSHTLDKSMYDLPLTLKTYVPSKWTEINVKQGDQINQVSTQKDENGTFVHYQAATDGSEVTLTEVE